MTIKTGDVLILQGEEDGEPLFVKVIDPHEAAIKASGPFDQNYRASCYTENTWLGPVRDNYNDARNDRYEHAQATGHTTAVLLVD